MVRFTVDEIYVGVEKGRYVLAENPWANPDTKLYKKAIAKGWTIKPGKILKKTPPWAKGRRGKEALSLYQLMVIEKFTQAAKKATSEKWASEWVAEELTGFRTGAPVRVREKTADKTLAWVRKRIEELRAKARAPTPTREVAPGIRP